MRQQKVTMKSGTLKTKLAPSAQLRKVGFKGVSVNFTTSLFIQSAKCVHLVCLLALLFGSPVTYAVNYEVYPGSAFYLTQMVDSVSYPYVAQNANGFYFHPVGFGASADVVLTTLQKQTICNNFSNRMAMVEGDMGYSNVTADIAGINSIASYGLKPIAAFVNRPSSTVIWRQLVANNAALNVPSYEMLAPHVVDNTAGGWNDPIWDYARSNLLISGCAGSGVDAPVYLYRNNGSFYRQVTWDQRDSTVAAGKKFNYLISPNESTNRQLMLDTVYLVQSLEDNGHEADVYGVVLYGLRPVDLTPETTNYNGVVQANWTITGLAYYLLKHRDGEPGTLDLFAASNTVSYAKDVMSPVLTNAAQIISFNPAQTNQFTLTLTNCSAWLDYAAVLRARADASQLTNWNITFQIGATDISSLVLSETGYVFLASQRLLPLASQDVTIKFSAKGAPSPLNLVIEALPHAGVDHALDVIAFQYQTNQSPPTLAFPVIDRFTRQGLSTAPIWFTAGDAETYSTQLTVTGVSSNTALVPNANIVFGQSGIQRWVNLTSATNQWGVAPITLTVSDGQFSTSKTFNLFVERTAILPVVKADNTVNLELTNSWAGGIVPSLYDQAVWDGTVTTANTTTLGADENWAGIKITGPGGPVVINGTNLLSIENSGVDMSAASQNLTLNCPLALNGASAWNVAAGRVVTANSSISGAGSLAKSGLGVVILSGENTYAGGTSIATSFGVTSALVVSNSRALGTGSVSIGSGGNTDGSRLELAGGITITNVLNSWASRNVATPNLLNISGTNTVNSNISGGGGGIQSTLQSASGSLVMLGTVATRQLNLQGGGNGELRGRVNIGTNSLIKNGSGIWTLTATNTYTGVTTINGGTLLINGRNDGSNAVNVNTGGALGGRGSLSGPVIIAVGGQLAPGTGIGVLTVSNTLTLSESSMTLVELNKSASTNDSVQGLSLVNYGGTLQVTNLAGTLATGDAFKLFYADGYAGAFASMDPSIPGAGLRWNTNTLAIDGTLRVTNAPLTRIDQITMQNGSLVLSITNGTPGLAAYVQSATNLLGPANWTRVSTNVFDSRGNLLWTNLINSSVPAIFFRIESP